jgi:predicted nucleic acid-binding protein
LAGVIVLDASAVIGVFSPADPHHELAAALLERHAPGGFSVHPVTLAECLVGAARAGRLTQLRLQIQNMGIEVFAPDRDEPLLIAEIRASTGLKLPDCCVLAASLALSAPLLTFDDNLRNSARARSIEVVDSIK